MNTLSILMALVACDEATLNAEKTDIEFGEVLIGITAFEDAEIKAENTDVALFNLEWDGDTSYFGGAEELSKLFEDGNPIPHLNPTQFKFSFQAADGERAKAYYTVVGHGSSVLYTLSGKGVYHIWEGDARSYLTWEKKKVTEELAFKKTVVGGMDLRQVDIVNWGADVDLDDIKIVINNPDGKVPAVGDGTLVVKWLPNQTILRNSQTLNLEFHPSEVGSWRWGVFLSWDADGDGEYESRTAFIVTGEAYQNKTGSFDDSSANEEIPKEQQPLKHPPGRD